MRACPQPPRVRDAGNRRFAAALFASAFVHALLSAGLTPGSAGRGQAGPIAVPSQIAARLVTPEAELPVTVPLVHNAPQREPAPPRRAREEVTARPTEIRSAPPAQPAGAGPAAIPDPTYYAARQLDVYPALTVALDVLYPGTPADAKGRVLLLVLIDAAGMVDDVSVVESEAPPYLQDDVRRALLTARFKPAVRSGVPVKSRLLVEIDYSAQERTQ